jgi:hypothetical protein
MSGFRRLLAIACLCAMSKATLAAGPVGLLGEWKFDEGKGDIARDSSGAGHNAKISGATWVKQGSGFALDLQSGNGYVDFGDSRALGVVGPISVEAWIKPAGLTKGEASLIGEGMSSYLLTDDGDEFFWYIGHGKTTNYVSTKLKLGEWNHVVATFGDNQLGLWINGRQAAKHESAVQSYKPEGHFHLGIQGRPDLPKFSGLIGRVRLYNHPLSADEVAADLRGDAAQYAISVQAPEGAAAEAATQFFLTHPNPVDLEERGNSLLFANKQVGLEILKSGTGFQLHRLYGIAEKQDFLTGAALIGFRDIFEIMMTLDPKRVAKDERWNTKGSLMGIMDQMAGDAFPIGSNAAKSVSWRRETQGAESVLHLEWKGMDVRDNPGVLDVDVTVSLREGEPLSFWRIAIRNRSDNYGIVSVRFPILRLAPIGKAEEDMLLAPEGRGRLLENPFSQRPIDAYYPYNFNMQFQALYNRQSGTGIYLGTRDPAPCLMNIQIGNTPAEIAWRPGHFPPNIAFATEDFALPYDCVAGPFHGDWFDACQIYRAWALKQTWCRKGPLLTRKDMPKWYKEAPLHFYTHLTDSAEGTHSLEGNIPVAAAHFREFLKWTGMRLGANFYGWKEYHPGFTTYDVPFSVNRVRSYGRWIGMPCENAHDGNYPRIPALPSFSEACKSLRADGGMVCPYLCMQIFDQGASENSPYAAEAKPNVTRDLYGCLRTWGGETSWQPCPGTQWWRDRLKETCLTMLERENVGGFYLDTMQGCGLPCFWTPHGHTAAGGNSMTGAKHGLADYVYNAVKSKDPDTITTGENPGENMIDATDGFLEVTLWSNTTAPLFGAVYQDYIKRFGLELSIGPGDAFFVECGSLFVEGSQIGMLRLRPRSDALSFQKPEHKEMLAFLGRIVGYYKQEATRKFLTYGQFMRPLEFRQPSPVPMLTIKTQYEGDGRFPALMSGVFRSNDGEIGIFVVNVSDKEIAFEAALNPSHYGIPAGTAVDVESITPEGQSKTVLSNASGQVPLKDSLPGHGIILFRLKTAARP